ncbi:glycosyltransferase domain-containing protein [Haloglomus salinum]|uniref:glycosyltransferase domain-containing protein n=1 Tax=Haloglomus salinum TaxID=2962673 RepID=UPI0020C95DBC|nr:glycosyltransferase domain-containing protein [Haloglomus salinum]
MELDLQKGYTAESDADTVVYTAIFDSYDTLIDPLICEEGADYICFTDDSELRSDIWDIVEVDSDSSVNPARLNRYLKLHPHKILPDYEYSIYIDGNIQIVSELVENCHTYLDNYSIAAHHHSTNNNVREEAESVVRYHLAPPDQVYRQLGRYFVEGFPDKQELTTNRVLYRKHNSSSCVELMSEWWSELSRETHRDQLSLNYILWRENTDIRVIQKPVWGSEMFEIHPHNPTDWRRYIWDYWMNIRVDRRENSLYTAIFYFIQALRIGFIEGIDTLYYRIRRKLSQ